MDDRYDVVVVGGGIAGLVAAATAARQGATVALVESRRLGGRARTTEQDGFAFNQGPHALYRAGALMTAATRLGVSVSGGVPPLDGAHVMSRGVRHRLPVRASELVRSSLLRVRSKVAARRVVGLLESGPAQRFASVSVSELLTDARSPADLTAFFEMLCRLSTYANAPDLMSAEAYVAQYRIATSGVLYLDGGWQQLVDGFAGAARSAGAKILDHRGVLGVGRDGSAWTVATAEGELAASAVVLATGLPAEASRLVGEDLGWVDAAGPPVRASCLDLGTAVAPEVPFLLDLEVPYYLSTHAPPAKLAPDGHRMIGVARYLRPGEEIDRATSEAGLWEHAARAGVARDAVVASRHLHAMVVAGGLPLAARGGFAGRPSVVVAERPGLYLAGDWVGSEGLIGDAAAASGAAAAMAACATLAARTR